MKVTREKTENSQAFLSIEVEPPELEKELEKAYRRLAQKANIPGFRKGKAPRHLVEQYLGKERLLEDAVSHMAPEVTDQAIKEQELKPVARPEVELNKVDPVVFKVVVPLLPTVNAGDYQKIKVEPESVQFKEEDVDKVIEQMRHQHAEWEPVERGAAYGDLLVMDIESNIGNQPYINQKEAQYQVTKDSDYPIKGFAEQLLEVKAGDNKEFKLQFAADYGRAELAGKEVTFKLNVKEVKQEKLSEVNDDFVKQMNTEVKSVAELREKVTSTLMQRAEEEAKALFEKKVIDAAVEQAQADFPPVFVEEEISRMINDQMRRWRMSDKGLDEYLKNIKKTEKELRDELRPMATSRVKQSLVLTEIAAKEKIEVSESEINAEIENMTKDMTEKKEDLIQFLYTPPSRQSISNVLATRKTIARLVDLASGKTQETKTTEKEATK